jgi:hypothetical protein
MGVFPRRSSLYRKRSVGVISFAVITFALSWASLICFSGCRLLGQEPTTQYGRKTPPDKGPRALGLVQLSGKKARIIPIAIMLDGKFYDAGSYKAAPVPMALDFGIVYEAFRTGVSQGVFTITQPGQLNHVWIAEGTWLPEGAIDPNKRKKFTAPVIADDDKDGPPVLHRRAGASDADDKTQSSKDADKDKSGDKDKDQTKKEQTTDDKDKKDEQKATSAGATPASTAPAAPTLSKPSETAKPPSVPDAAKPSTSSSEAANDEPIGDPNRPRLRRGKPVHAAHQEPFTTFDAGEPLPGASPSATPPSGKDDASAKSSTALAVLVPAISDAGGPDPRPYTYDLKPEEEASYRSKMLDLAAAQLHIQEGAAKKESASNSKNSRSAKPAGKAAKTTTPVFDEVKLRIFDLSSSNEPVLVLSAKTHPVPPAAGANGSVEEPKEITLIARSNLENELQKLFFSQTDSRHLDIAPRMELIDAVDADGDGRGELLFRRTFDDGSAYAIYRVSRDGLWPLFEGTP